MALPIQSVGAVPALADPRAVAPVGGAPGEFRNALAAAVEGVERMRVDADTRVQRFISEEGEELHSVALATQRAEMSLELFQQMRNKVVQAYQEVMRMQM
jgi:flagellar hook-basal body complex protein FliE